MTSYEWVKLSWNKNYAPHYMPCCPHLDNPNLALILGVPVYATDDILHSYLSKYGSIIDVKSQPKPSATPKFHIPNKSKYFTDLKSSSSFRCVFVQFKESDGLSQFMSSAKMGLTIEVAESAKPLLGVKKWVTEYEALYPDENSLREECEDYMSEFDERERLKMEREKLMAETPDEDGWITVTKSSKLGASAESAKQKKKLYDKKMEERKKDTLHLYSFQEREKRKEALANLKQKFQEDKEKIAKMKSARKFKPY